MNRRLVIASAVLLLLLLTVALVGLGSAVTATGATPAPQYRGAMSGDFTHVPMACANACSAPSIFVPPDRWPAAHPGARHRQASPYPSSLA